LSLLGYEIFILPEQHGGANKLMLARNKFLLNLDSVFAMILTGGLKLQDLGGFVLRVRL
jgi:hypothetical protein